MAFYMLKSCKITPSKSAKSPWSFASNPIDRRCSGSIRWMYVEKPGILSSPRIAGFCG